MRGSPSETDIVQHGRTDVALDPIRNFASMETAAESGYHEDNSVAQVEDHEPTLVRWRRALVSSAPPSSPRLEGKIPDDFATLWDGLRFDSQVLAAPVEATIRPAQAAEFAEDPTLDAPLPPHTSTSTGDMKTLDLQLLHPIGEGGMGLVRLAQQVSLKREVAVKTIRPQLQSNAKNRQALAQEALITGALEHPNVIPIYALGEDSNGAPLIVMKRVEGVSWRSFLVERQPLPEGAVALEYHLDVLLQVANALSFAHSRGIIHRDVKPENVMIGSFGEVYLLDWGLALSLRPEHRDVFPLAAEATDVVGTPAYMSPEMTTGTGALLGPHTDVYLLGATLYEILTGKARHDGATLREVMESAYASRPCSFPSAVPRELAEICNKATAREPRDRHSSVEAFRTALIGFLRHRTSIQLSDEGRERLSRMLLLFEARLTPEVDHQIRDLFGECRFGFEQALKTWPENVEAQAGMEHARRAMAEHEIRQKNLSAARALIATIHGERAELEAALTALEREIEAERREVDRLREAAHQTDRTLGARGRALAALVCGSGASGSLVLIDLAERFQIAPLTHASYFLGWGAVLITSVAALFVFFRRHMFVNQITTQIGVGSFTALAVILGFRALVYMEDLPFELAFRFELILYGLALGMLGVISNYRVLAAVPICIVGAVVDGLISGDGLVTIAATIFLAFVAVAWAWGSTVPGETPGTPGEDDGLSTSN